MNIRPEQPGDNVFTTIFCLILICFVILAGFVLSAEQFIRDGDNRAEDVKKQERRLAMESTNKLSFKDWLWDLLLLAQREKSPGLIGKDHHHLDSYVDGMSPKQELDRLIKANKK